MPTPRLLVEFLIVHAQGEHCNELFHNVVCYAQTISEAYDILDSVIRQYEKTGLAFSVVGIAKNSQRKVCTAHVILNDKVSP